MKKQNEKGSIYTLVLASSLVLVALVLGLSYQILQFRKTARTDNQIDQASVYAEMGIRHALFFTSDDNNWRQHLSSGQWLQNISTGDAVYSVSGIDPIDGVLNNNDNHPVILTCTAQVNGITRKTQVKTRQQPLDQLRYALTATGTITISNHVHVTGNVFTNSNINKSGSNSRITGNAKAVGTIDEQTNISGTITTGVKSKVFPSAQKIRTYYQDRATSISYRNEIKEVLLSHTSNPYGQVNTDGLYVINCANQKIVIRDCRIVGTLLLINPKSDSRIESAINWRPARTDYPALIIISGDFTIQPSKNLDEDDIDVDLSLPEEPGRGDDDDVFPNLIKGLVYCAGNLTLDKKCTVQGSVMAEGNLELKDYSAPQYNSGVYNNTPPMFRQTWLAPVHGTWREVLPP